MHQLPGVWVCTTHNELLFESTEKSTGVGRFLWHLPDASSLRSGAEPPSTVHLNNTDLELLCGLSDAAAGLAALPSDFHFQPGILQDTYRTALAKRGLTHVEGGLKLRLIGQSFAAAVAPLRVMRELSALPESADDAASSVGRLLETRRSGTHPLRHLALILWLFDNWDAFWRSYSTHSAVPNIDLQHDPISPPNPKAIEPDSRRIQLVNYLRNDQMAVSRAAMLVGVDPATAKSWAAQAGISTPRRAKILKPLVYEKVIRELERGLPKLAVAKSHGVSVETVTRILRTEVGLRSAWNDAKDALARESARAQFVEAANAHPAFGAKAIRLLAPAAYAWLYRNDRAWLTDFVTSLVSAPRGNYAAVDWPARDAMLAAEIRQATLSLNSNGEAGRLPLCVNDHANRTRCDHAKLTRGFEGSCG